MSTYNCRHTNQNGCCDDCFKQNVLNSLNRHPDMKRIEALERVTQAVRGWQAVDDLVLELEMYALERSEHELRIIAALEALDKLCETK